MEFLEYYRIVRDRIWIILLTASVAAVIVIVYSLVPPSSYTAKGRILVRPEAGLTLQLVGEEVSLTSFGDRAGPWATLFEFLASEGLKRQAAFATAQAAAAAGRERDAAAIRDPRRVEALKPIQGRQLSASQIGEISASAPTPYLAVELTNRAMETLQVEWDRFRLRRVAALKAEISEIIDAVEADLAPLQAKMDRWQQGPGGAEAGTPSSRLAAAEAQILTLEGQLEGARLEAQLAQDNVNTLRSLQASGEAAALGGAQQFGGILAGELRTLHEELKQKRDELQRQLKYRTDEHPAVQALRESIAKLEESIAELRRGDQVPPGAGSPLAAQILDAQLAAQNAQRRGHELQMRIAELKGRLPELREAARRYEEDAAEYNEVLARKQALEAQRKKLDAEEARLQAALDTAERLARLRESGEEQAPEDATQQPAEAALDITITDYATLEEPGNKLVRTLFLLFTGIVGGLVIGIIAVLLLHYVDVTFKNAYEAERLIRREVLGSIPRTDIMLAPVEAMQTTETGSPAEGPAGVDAEGEAARPPVEGSHPEQPETGPTEPRGEDDA